MNGGRGVLINGIYRDQPVGSGTWTRFLSRMLPEAKVWGPKRSLVGGTRSAFYAKTTAEFAFRLRPARLRLHPYWAAAWDPNAVLSILDLFGMQEMNVGLRRLYLKAARRARGLLTISQQSAESIRRQLGCDCTVIYPVPEPPFFAPVKPPPLGHLRLAYWGGSHPRKRLSATLSALEATRMKIEVVCASSSRPDPDFPFVTRVPVPSSRAVAALADACQISIFPSAAEGFGLPVYESLLRGRPAIVRDLPVYREFVSHPASGLVFIRGCSPSEWADAVERAEQLSKSPLTVRASLRNPDQATALECSRYPLIEFLNDLDL